MKKFSRNLVASLFVVSTVILPNAFLGIKVYSQETKEQAQSQLLKQSKTTEDITIPVEDLKLLVKPLTVDELGTESDAWLLILKNKVQEISFAEIAINKQNRAVDIEEEAVKNLEEAQQQLLEAEQAQKNATQGTPEYEKAAEKVEEAKQKFKEAQESVNKVLEAKKELEEDENLTGAVEKAEENKEIEEARNVLEEARKNRNQLTAGSQAYKSITEKIDTLDSAIRAIELSQEKLQDVTPESEDFKTLEQELEGNQQKLKQAIALFKNETSTEGENAPKSADQLKETNEISEKSDDVSDDSKVPAASDNEINLEDSVEEKKQQIDEITEVLEEDAQNTSELKQQLVVAVTELQEQQTAIIDRFEVVLSEYEYKGGDPESYENYIKAISSVNLNVQDTEGLGIRIVGWLKSEEGGIRLLIIIGKFIGVAVVVSIASYILSGVVKKTLNQFDSVSNLLTDFIVITIKRGGIVLGVVLGLAVAGLNLGPLLALLGGISFILAFALQNNLGNFASGLMLMINKPFDVGDEVKIAGYWSYIYSIDLANTRLKKFDGSIVTLPNNSVWGGEIQNFTVSEIRKFATYIYVKFDQDLDTVYTMWMSVASSNPKVLKEPSPGWFPWNSHFESYICVGLNCWVDTNEFWGVYIELLKELQKQVKKFNIQLTAPIHDIRVEKSSGNQNGLYIDAVDNPEVTNISG